MKKENVFTQTEIEELRQRLRYWQTLSIEQRLQWLESAMRFVYETKNNTRNQ